MERALLMHMHAPMCWVGDVVQQASTVVPRNRIAPMNMNITPRRFIDTQAPV